MTSTTIYNPQLEGDAFLWEGGPTGVLLDPRLYGHHG